MHRGMLWYDNNEKTNLKQKVTGAMKFFKNKYGYSPDVCEVHVDVEIPVKNMETEFGTIEIINAKGTLPNHFLLYKNG